MKINLKALLPKTKTEWVLVSLYLLFFLGDIISTLIHGSLVSQLESNPLYMMSNTLLVPILFNLLVLFGLIFVYRRYGINMRWYITTFVVWLSFIRIVVILNNVMAYLNPPTAAQAEAISQALQTDYSTVIFPMILLLVFYFVIPIILALLSFWIYRLDHTIERKQGGD